MDYLQAEKKTSQAGREAARNIIMHTSDLVKAHTQAQFAGVEKQVRHGTFQPEVIPATQRILVSPEFQADLGRKSQSSGSKYNELLRSDEMYSKTTPLEADNEERARATIKEGLRAVYSGEDNYKTSAESRQQEVPQTAKRFIIIDQGVYVKQLVRSDVEIIQPRVSVIAWATRPPSTIRKPKTPKRVSLFDEVAIPAKKFLAARSNSSAYKSSCEDQATAKASVDAHTRHTGKKR